MLEVDQNALASVPASMGQLSKLEVLAAGANRSSFGLQVLNLAQNNITTLEPLITGSLPGMAVR